MFDPAEVRARLGQTRDRITRAARRAGRDPDGIRLVAVSKTFPSEYIRTVAAAGHIDFGENKVQEALPKIAATGGLRLRWHLIGHLQSNKARKAGASFDMVHSVDDGESLSRLDDGAREASRQVDLLVQVDLAGEATKHGAQPQDVPGIIAAADAYPSLHVVGLMLLPPRVDHPEEARPYFARLRKLREELILGGVEPSRLAHLSMGMSSDFEVAVEEGATIVRVGAAIFGERPEPARPA